LFESPPFWLRLSLADSISHFVSSSFRKSAILVVYFFRQVHFLLRFLCLKVRHFGCVFLSLRLFHIFGFPSFRKSAILVASFFVKPISYFGFFV
jgi:hypothetical protein